MIKYEGLSVSPDAQKGQERTGKIVFRITACSSRHTERELVMTDGHDGVPYPSDRSYKPLQWDDSDLD